MTSEDTGLAASIHQRLLNLSKARSLDFNLLLARFAIERFLYRLSQSPYADVFVLKGAMLLQVWLADTSRPTRDLDLLGFGDVSAERLRAIFAAVSAQPAAADGCQFHADSVTVAAIPVGLPTALTAAFAQNPTKARQWQAFLKKNNLSHAAKDFGSVIGLLARFLGPVLQAAHAGASFPMEWPPEGPWTIERDVEPQQEKPGAS